jgi:hypothetical protein
MNLVEHGYQRRHLAIESHSDAEHGREARDGEAIFHVADVGLCESGGEGERVLRHVVLLAQFAQAAPEYFAFRLADARHGRTFCLRSRVR